MRDLEAPSLPPAVATPVIVPETTRTLSMPLTWPCHSEGISQSGGSRHPPVRPEMPSVGEGELTPSSSFTQLGGVWMRDLDLGAKLGPSARALWRGFGAASECQDRHRPTTPGAVGIMPEW
jgi:hypothetical protein